MDTYSAYPKTIRFRLDKWRGKINLVSIDMTHINRCFKSNEKVTESVDGIIGADVLKKSKAVIRLRVKQLVLENYDFMDFNIPFAGSFTRT